MSAPAAAPRRAPAAATATAEVDFAHLPVLLPEVLALAALPPQPRLLVDCTVGGGGHAAALLTAHPQATLLGLDRDPSAIAAAGARLRPFGARARLVQAPFAALPAVLADCGLGPADVLLADFGVSSHQLDTPHRGFSFRADAPLDMRMDVTCGVPAWELLASMDEAALAAAVRELGEERHARRVARSVLAAQPRTTAALAAAVRRVVPPARDGLDPATRTFQAVRMLVNDELGQIDAWLRQAPALLAPAGVVVAIAFHSLEDRAVKQALRAAAHPCRCPPRLPVCVCGLVPTLRVLTRRPERPTAAAARANPRARSGRLRAAQKLPRSLP